MIKHTYDADGNRVKKDLVGGTTTHYIRGAAGETIAVYENGSREFINLIGPSGDMIGTWDGSQRRYFLKDHLGSIRTTVDQSGNVDGYDDYYAFGLVMPGRSSNSANPTDNYKYTGHEFDEEAGLDMYHMNARTMDPVIGRFMQIDPMLQYSSPYTYVGNNPLLFTDPTGMLGEYFDDNGNYLGSDGIDDKKVYLANKGEGKSIKKLLKKGGTERIQKAQASSTFLASEDAIIEAGNVLQRTIDNGGLSGESSLVSNDGTILRGETGEAVGADDRVSKETLPGFLEGNVDLYTSIHSHITGFVKNSDGSFGVGNATQLGPLDEVGLAGFNNNIIVGPLGQSSVGSGGNLLQPSLGVAFFGKNPTQQANPRAQIRLGSLNKIINKLKRK